MFIEEMFNLTFWGREAKGKRSFVAARSMNDEGHLINIRFNRCNWRRK